jgi:hypothetical protein
MRRFLVLIAAGLLGVLSIPTTGSATGAIDTGDAAMLQRVMPAVPLAVETAAVAQSWRRTEASEDPRLRLHRRSRRHHRHQ